MDSQSQNTVSPTSATASAGDPVGATQSTNANSHDDPNAINPVVSAPEPKLPSRKDVSLAEFTKNLKNVKSIIPEAVVDYQMTRAGINPNTQPEEFKNLIALATQKFIADIASDAYQFAKIRQGNSSSNNPMGNLGTVAAGAPAAGAGGAGGAAGDKGGRAAAGVLGVQRPGYGGGGQGGSQNRTVLTMEDLGMAVGEYGVNVKRGEFYR